jgi:hypothetical protein
LDDVINCALLTTGRAAGNDQGRGGNPPAGLDMCEA